MQFGIFNDEGLVDGGFHTAAHAAEFITENYTAEDELEVLEQCSGHPDHAAISCEMCNEEEN